MSSLNETKLLHFYNRVERSESAIVSAEFSDLWGILQQAWAQITLYLTCTVQGRQLHNSPILHISRIDTATADSQTFIKSVWAESIFLNANRVPLWQLIDIYLVIASIAYKSASERGSSRAGERKSEAQRCNKVYKISGVLKTYMYVAWQRFEHGQVSREGVCCMAISLDAHTQTHTHTHTHRLLQGHRPLSGLQWPSDGKRKTEERVEAMCSTSSSMTLNTNLLLSGPALFQWM